MMLALYALAMAIPAPQDGPADTFALEEIAPSIYVASKADPPTLTFQRELVLHLGDRTIVIRSNGPGNTKSVVPSAFWQLTAQELRP